MANATQLIQALTDHPLGLCGQHDPAKSIQQVEALEERLNLLAFGAVMSTDPLPASGWETLAALHDHWLFLPGQVSYRPSQEVLACMQALHIRAPGYIARVWWQVCRGVQGRFKGSWRDLLAANGDDAQALEGYLLQSKSTFPVLSGPVVSVRWMDLVQRIGGVPLQGWDDLRVPLSPHLVEAACTFGVAAKKVHPCLAAALEVWATACRGDGQGCGLDDCPRRRADR